jgi:uncharacterized protein involved in exopolysaccharide biosynthesis
LFVNGLQEEWDEVGARRMRALYDRLWRYRWIIVLCVVLSTAGSAAIAYMTTPIYRASIVLMPATADRSGLNSVLNSALGQFGGVASLVGVGKIDSGTEDALAVLSSRQFTEKFINDLHLMPLLFADRWDTATNTWKGDVRHQPTPAKASKLFDKSIRTIVKDKKTGLITVSIDWKDRIQAADLDNQLIERLNDEMRGRAAAKAAASIGFLENELRATTDVGTRDAVNRLIEDEVKQRMLADVTREYAIRVVDKALPPDADDKLKPKKFRMLMTGGGAWIHAIGYRRAAVRQTGQFRGTPKAPCCVRIT